MNEPLYPSPPVDVPADLTVASPSYRRKTWLAVGGLVGFLLAYVALTGWFGYKAFTLLRDSWSGGAHWVAAAAAGAVSGFLALFLGKALVFIRNHEDPAQLEITADDEPQLFAFLHRLAADTGAKPPHRVFLSPRVNAAVFYDLSVLNLIVPSRKNLEIGVGLVNVLTLAELKAVLAHEYGHFAQRTMAVGSWLYIGQQIAAHIVAKRDAFDGFLRAISNIDIRIAWIGWGLRIIVWSIRSVMDSLFGVIVMAERALSREMELQADLVAVSVTGSDALVHALHKLPAADSAWDSALDLFIAELRKGRQAPDLCAMQARVLDHTRWVLNDTQYGRVPPLPEARAQHRLFTAGLAQPPQMWSTHPPSHLREDNAKRRYIAAELDDRSAWLIFRDPAQTQLRMAEHVAKLAEKPDEVTPIDGDAAIAVVDASFAKPYLDPRYRGAYLGRRITRCLPNPDALLDPICSDAAAIRTAILQLYPESLSDAVERARALAGEVAQLEAIERGVATAAGGVIRWGGREFRKRELASVIAEAKGEHTRAVAELQLHDRAVRSTARDAAALIGRGWPEYLAGLRALLHYAEHAEADVDDAGAQLGHVLRVVTADGRISEREQAFLAEAGRVLWGLLRGVHTEREAVVIPFAVAKELGVESWAAALPDSCDLVYPSKDALPGFMDTVWDWFAAYSSPLGALRNSTVAVLLEAERHVTTCFVDGSDPGDAYGEASAPAHAFCDGQERELPLQLNAWDRFMTADGLGPGIARFAVAGAVVSLVVGIGGSVGTPTVVIHNPLGREVVVSIAGENVSVPAHGRQERELAVDDELVHVLARTTDGEEIEAFDGDVGNSVGEYLYNIGGGGALVRWVVVYGPGKPPEPELLGAPRWMLADADHILTEPPESVSSRSPTKRTVISAPALAPIMTLAPLEPGERERVALFHARWEPSSGADAQWLTLASGMTGFGDVLQARLAAGEHNVMLGRLAQDSATKDERPAVCARDRAAADAAPNDPDLAYLAARCLDDEAEKNRRFVELQARFPDHAWLLVAAAYAHFENGDTDRALADLERGLGRLPEVADSNAVLLARMKRLAAPDGTPDLSYLTGRSPELELLLALDAGKSEDDPQLTRAFARLRDGALDDAVAAASADDRAKVLRLAAASEHASTELVLAVLQLDPLDGITASTVWTALAFAKTRSLDVEPLLGYVRERAPELEADMLRFVDRQWLEADLDRATRAMHALHPELRGQAAVMGLITLGAAAPADWRVDATRLLFASERPWFAPPS